MFNRELKKGSPELLILALLEDEDRHGYEIGKLIEARSGGRLQFRIGSLYPILCRLEAQGLILGRWVEKAGERRRRFYRVTPKGRIALAEQRSAWEDFTGAVNQILGGENPCLEGVHPQHPAPSRCPPGARSRFRGRPRAAARKSLPRSPRPRHAQTRSHPPRPPPHLRLGHPPRRARAPPA